MIIDTPTAKLDAVQFQGFPMEMEQIPEWYLQSWKKGEIQRDGQFIRLINHQGDERTLGVGDWIIHNPHAGLADVGKEVFPFLFGRLPKREGHLGQIVH